ncbi:MAG: phosphatase PAP2 family protein [Spirochaetia bacterium]|nr:phosphatase PAP2 family protein [Spirochaetia bacterium]
MRVRRLIGILLVFCSLGGSLGALSFEYNEELSTVSTITAGLSLVLPSVIAFTAPAADYLKIGTSYATTILTSYYGIRSPLKALVDKPRPYVGEVNRPLDTSEDYDSFPSGHSLMSFAAAAYTHTAYRLWYPDSKTLKTASIAVWALAATTAALRVASGNHYLEDVLAGAAIGSLVGFLGPYLTNKLFYKDHSMQLLVGSTVGMRVTL